MNARGIPYLLALWVLGSTWAWAGEIVPRVEVDGSVYENVRWGPVNDGEVTVFHNRGVATVPVAKLPIAHQRQLRGQPVTDSTADSAWARLQRAREDARRAARQAEYQQYQRDCERVAVFNEQVVDKSKLTGLIGLVRAKATIEESGVVTPGAMLELVQPKEGLEKIPPQLRMRPGLWQGTGTQVFLRDYPASGDDGRPIRVWGEEGPAIEGHRTFFIARELTFEQWQQWRTE